MRARATRRSLRPRSATSAEPVKPIDVAVHPKNFAATQRSAIRLVGRDDPPLDERFPRTWIVAAEDVPAHVPAAEYVHVPWTSLLHEETGFRSAGELSATLQDAGVERFSEIVCYSNQPAEAAVAYVALRLLGYPLVRLYLPKTNAL